MRLINTTTYELKFFIGSQIPIYAILSHCWGDDEVTLQDYERSRDKSGRRFKKIRDCCSLAVRDQIEWAWIDTCCIDKTSSAELSEAINSMFKWYERAAVCYAFLEDNPGDGDLSKCRWFTRGWTLQELLAPSNVQFHGRDLEKLGDKEDLAEQIEDITGIPRIYLEDKHRNPVGSASISQRMSWASERVLTREEDIAYSLLGIFDINMPLLYGEGSKAFIRLQENLMARSDDESLFCWTASFSSSDPDSLGRSGLLALSPHDFRYSGDISPAPFALPRPPYVLTNQGLRFHVARTSILQWLINRDSARRNMDLQCVHKDGSRVSIEVRDDEYMLHRSPFVKPGRNLYPRGYIETVAMGGYSERLVSVRPRRTPHHLPKATIGATLVDAVFLVLSCLLLQILIEMVSFIIPLGCIVGSILLRTKSARLQLGQFWLLACLMSYHMLYAFHQSGPLIFWMFIMSWTSIGLVLTLIGSSLPSKQSYIRPSFATSWLQHQVVLELHHLMFLPLFCMVLSALWNITLGRAMLHLPEIFPEGGISMAGLYSYVASVALYITFMSITELFSAGLMRSAQ